MSTKYKLLNNDFIEIAGNKLFRIKALKSFSNVEKGELGGYIASESNLSHCGDCWVYEDAKVWGDAKVYGNAVVSGNAMMWGNAMVSGNAKVYGNAEVIGTHSETERTIQKAPKLGKISVDKIQRAVDSVSAPTNPKDKLGKKKVPLEMIPDTALMYAAMAFKEGDRKYNSYNWRTDAVAVHTYVAAAKRHLAQYWNGEDWDVESGAHNLGCVIACCMILLDAGTCNMLIDDRPLPAPITDVMKQVLEKYKNDAI